MPDYLWWDDPFGEAGQPTNAEMIAAMEKAWQACNREWQPEWIICGGNTAGWLRATQTRDWFLYGVKPRYIEQHG